MWRYENSKNFKISKYYIESSHHHTISAKETEAVKKERTQQRSSVAGCFIVADRNLKFSITVCILIYHLYHLLNVDFCSSIFAWITVVVEFWCFLGNVRFMGEWRFTNSGVYLWVCFVWYIYCVRRIYSQLHW